MYIMQSSNQIRTELIICDHFKWTLEDVKNLSLFEFKQVIKYLKKLEAENKKALRKSKQRKRW